MSGEKSARVAQAIEGARPTSSGWCYAQCPLCSSRRRSLSVSIESGWWQCFRCGEKGKLRERVDFGAALPAPPPPKATEWESLADPSVRASLAAQPALDYLARRGVAPSTLELARLGVAFTGRYRGRIVLPVVDDAGVIVGVVARAYTPSSKPYDNTPGMERVCMPGRECLLTSTPYPAVGVEGPFDALPYWGSAWTHLGKPTTDQLDWIAMHTRRPVVLALDGDAWREGHAAAMRLQLRGVQARAVRLPPLRDPGDFDIRPLLGLIECRADQTQHEHAS